jgi:hypothetical protein
LKKLLVALVALAVFAPAALASSSHFLKVSPGKVRQGHTVTISGSVDHGCRIGHTGDTATIYSKAFKAATRHNFAGIPSISVSLANSHNGSFSTTVKLAKHVTAKWYRVSGRCGGGNFGSTFLNITHPGNGLPQGY